MTLLDHFHPPLKKNPLWEGVHAGWASSISRLLNRKLLPKRYRAVPLVTHSGRIEIDVATLRQDDVLAAPGDGGGVATAVWAPARPTIDLAVDFVDLDSVEVQVFDEEGQHLVAAVELVSPRNKDRPTAREAFVIKCANYLQNGVSVLIVDVVTERTANLHRQLLELLQLSGQTNGREFPPLYAVAYRTFTSSGKGQLQAWEETLAVGRPLPILPLWIDLDKVVPLDLQATYRETCEDLRIPT
jgi:hypothetical protein